MKENKHGATKIASNMYVKTIDGIVFLFSYNTPVAFEGPYGKFRTDEHFSCTTTRHINKYFGKGVGEIVEHQTIMRMAGLA